MSSSKTLHPALRQYIDVLRTLAPESVPSVFWERQLETFQATYARIEELSPAELDQLVRAGSYGFEELPNGVDGPAADPAYRSAAGAIRKARKLGKQLSADGLGLDKEQWEHLRTLDFLERRGLLDAFLRFIEPLGVRSSMSVARHWYYATEIAALSRRVHGERALDVLEIGAGAGNLALFLTRLGIVRSYTIVDLPQMLVHSAYTLQQRLEVLDLRFNVAPTEGAYTFVADFRAAELLRPDSFDLELNLNSFMEMDRAVRDSYIALIYRAGRSGSLFYNVNRRQPALPLHDGGTWDNNPLLYPYRDDDEVLVWEDDPYQTVTRGKWGARPTLTITRAAIIRPGRAPAREAG